MVANFWRYFSLLLDKKGLIFGCVQFCSKFAISLLISLLYVLSGFSMFRKTKRSIIIIFKRYTCKHLALSSLVNYNSCFNSLMFNFFDQKLLIISYTSVTLTVHCYKYPVDCFSRAFLIRNSNSEERNSEKVG